MMNSTFIINFLSMLQFKFENFNAIFSFHNMTYSKEVMESAIEEVKTGASSIHGAARKYGISSSTLCMIISQRDILK